MEATTPTSQPGAVGGGGDSGSGSSQTPPVLNWPALTDRQKIDAIYRLKCIAAEQELAQRLPRVWEYCEKHRAAGRSWHWCYGLKLLELWDILNRYCPSSICELGSGCTTAVFAAYCAESGAKLTTVDENADWQSFVKQYVPGAIEWLTLPVGWVGKSAVFYEGVELRHDFVYVDGPSNRISGSTDCAKCIDVLYDMAQGHLPMVVFDIRRETVRFLGTIAAIMQRYSWEMAVWSDGDVPWYLSSLRHHTIARRRA